MRQRVLITGASIAGLSTAFWLARCGWEVEIVARSDRFREGGQNVDVRGAAHQVLDRMGLTAAVRDANTTELGTSFVGGRGQLLGRIPVEQEQDGPTAELEILRGDLARIIHDALPDSATLRYGDRIETTFDTGQQVSVSFQSGRADTYDLVVIAEGVRSRTRHLIFGSSVRKRELGLNMAYGTIPAVESDDRWWRWYAASERRGLTLRPDRVGSIRATLAYIDRTQDLTTLSLESAKAQLAEVFRDAGWQARRVTDGFLDSNDIYVDYLTQIRMSTWARGRVVVTGDAAWCVTPLGGGGTSLALTGAYVLAASLSRSEQPDPAVALQQYEDWMRPLITDSQQLPKGTPDLFYPDTAAGIALLRTMQRLVTTRPLRRVAARLSHVAASDRPLPEMADAP